MLFKITQGDVFSDNPELETVPEYAVCNSKELKYIFFLWDYKSPLRQLPLADRRKKAAMTAGYGIETNGKTVRPDRRARDVIAGKSPRVNEAEKFFKESRYDEDMETYLAVVEQIRQFKEFLNKKDKTSKELKDTLAIIKLLNEAVKIQTELRIALGIDEDESIDDALPQDNMSTIDKINLGLI